LLHNFPQSKETFSPFWEYFTGAYGPQGSAVTFPLDSLNLIFFSERFILLVNLTTNLQTGPVTNSTI
jgi:hypothetical protein